MPARALSISPAARAQLGIFLFAYLLYSAARFVTIGDLGVAQANADWIMDLQDDLGVSVEQSVQQAPHRHLDPVAAQPPVPRRPARRAPRLAGLPLPALAPACTSACATRSSPPGSSRSRSTPPSPSLPRGCRLRPVDTITAETGLSLDSSLTTSFYNELAAVPSLHVGFAVVIGLAVAAAVRNPIVKVVAWLWGPVIALAVVATGNHYMFDIAAGVVAAGAGYMLGSAVARAVRMRGSTMPASGPEAALRRGLRGRRADRRA